MNPFGRWLWLLTAVLALAACSLATERSVDSWGEARQPDGSVVWLDEYHFEPPPPPWRLIDLNDRDLSLAFYKSCPAAATPCEASTMAYAEEPFGSSRELEERVRQFFRRHLWASRVRFAEPEWRFVTNEGRQELEVWAQGTEPVTGQKVLTKVLFRYRGERVTAFFMNQWRGADVPFERAEFAELDRFAASFRFLGPSFYERLPAKGS
jgi:hypothetical protein